MTSAGADSPPWIQGLWFEETLKTQSTQVAEANAAPEGVDGLGLTSADVESFERRT
jgi:hypothetical protein